MAFQPENKYQIIWQYHNFKNILFPAWPIPLSSKSFVSIILTLYWAMLHICNMLFSTLLLSVVKLISLLCVFIAIFELLLVRPQFLNYFLFIYARVMVRHISPTQGSEKRRGTYLFCHDIVSSHELV